MRKERGGRDREVKRKGGAGREGKGMVREVDSDAQLG